MLVDLPNSTSAEAPPTSLSNHERAQITDLEEELRSLRSQLETAKSQLETSLAHSVCAGWEIKSLKEQLNLQNNAKKRKVRVNAKYVSSTEPATRMLDEQAREEAEKRQRDEVAQAAKRAMNNQCKQQREAGDNRLESGLGPEEGV